MILPIEKLAYKPNKITFGAMKEAEESTNLETLDINDFRTFVESL